MCNHHSRAGVAESRDGEAHRDPGVRFRHEVFVFEMWRAASERGQGHGIAYT